MYNNILLFFWFYNIFYDKKNEINYVNLFKFCNLIKIN